MALHRNTLAEIDRVAQRDAALQTKRASLARVVRIEPKHQAAIVRQYDVRYDVFAAMSIAQRCPGRLKLHSPAYGSTLATYVCEACDPDMRRS
jgi:hypothetical protein